MNFKTLITMKTVAWDICFNEIREFDKKNCSASASNIRKAVKGRDLLQFKGNSDMLQPHSRL